MNNAMVLTCTGINYFYGVETFYKHLNKSVQYILDVAYVAETDIGYICNIQRKRFFIDKEEVQGVVDSFAEKCMNVIYPITLEVDKNMGVIDIVNFEEVQERWQNSIPTIKREFGGEFSEEYINQVTDNLKSKTSFKNALYNDPIYHVLFFKKPVALNRKKILQENIVHTFPYKPYEEPVSFEGNRSLEFNPDGTVFFSYTGEDTAKHTLFCKHLVSRQTKRVINAQFIYKSVTNKQEVILTVTELKERRKEYEKEVQTTQEIPKELVKKRKWFVNPFKK